MNKFSVAVFTIINFSLVGCSTGETTQEISNNSVVSNLQEADIAETKTEVKIDENLPTYTVATVKNYSPFVSTDDMRNATGFDIDILQAIAEVEGFNLHFVGKSWSGWQRDLAEGKVDIWAAGITIKDERKKYAAYSDSYLSYKTAVLSINNNVLESNIEKYKLGAEANSTSFGVAQSLQPSSDMVVGYASTYQAFTGLMQKDVDAVVGNNLVLANIATLYEDFDFHVRPLSTAVTDTKQLGFMFNKADQALVKQINSGLKKIKKNGRYDEIKKQWFGKLDV